MADEVEDVVGVEQRALQGGAGWRHEDDELELTRVDEVPGRGLEQLPLAVDGERRHVARAGDHHEHPERGCTTAGGGTPKALTRRTIGVRLTA